MGSLKGDEADVHGGVIAHGDRMIWGNYLKLVEQIAFRIESC